MNMLRKWMKDRKLRVVDMAALISGEPGSEHQCSAVAVGRWLRGERQPSKRYIERIQQVTAGAVPASAWFETPVLTPEQAVDIAMRL